MNEEHLAILKKGVEEWNKWRKENPDIRPDLHGTDLRGFDLRRAKLSGIDFRLTNFCKANLRKADFLGANLRGADLFGADLHEADLLGTNLRQANLRNVNLCEADLREANLTGALLENVILTDCRIGGTVFGLTNLNTCKDLDTIKVRGECVIDFQTLRDSKNLPKDFLFKIGVPENFINYLPDFYDETPIKLHSVFLSHSSEDKAFAEKFYNSLIQNRVHVWYDERELLPGDEIAESVSGSIKVYDKLIIICSQNSLENSLWVKKELIEALKKEENYLKKHGKKINTIIPITIDDYVFSGKSSSAIAQLHRYKIADMKNWQDEEVFHNGLQKVIKALNADRKNLKPPSFL